MPSDSSTNVPQLKGLLAFLLAALLLFSFPTNAEAACASPAGVAGAMIYNKDWHVPQYCNNTNWIGFGKATNAACEASVTSMASTNANGVWGDGTYIYVADQNGTDAYTFNGTTLTLAGTISNITGFAYDVWGDGTYIYLANDTSLKAYTFNGTTFTLAGTIATTAARGVFGDGTYIYVADGASGIKAFTFNGTAFTQVGNAATTNAKDIWIPSSGYIFLADGTGGLKAYTFNGATFTLKASIVPASTDATDVWSDNSYIHLAENGVGGVKVFTFSGSSFTQVSWPVGGNADAVWGDGNYIYVAAGGNFQAYKFNGSTYTLVRTIPMDNTRAIWGDGNYVYLARYTYGLFVFKPGICGCAGPSAPEGTIMYNADNRVMQYCNGTAWQAMGKTAYKTYGVDFTGSNYLQRAADMTGGADSKTFTVSFWFRRQTGSASIQHIYTNENGRFDVYIDASLKLHVTGKGTGGGAVVLDMNGDTSITNQHTNWNHVFISFDMNDTAKRHIYLNGAPQTLTVTTYTNAVIDFTRTNHVVGGSATTLGTEMFTGELADLFISQTYMAPSSTAVMRKFVDSAGAPVDLGPTCNYPTGTTPIVCLSAKSAAAWPANKGGGGGMTLVGTLPLADGNYPGLDCSPNGSLGLVGSITTGEDNDIWGDGTYVYMAEGFAGLKAYTFNGTTFTQAGSIATSAVYLWYRAPYIFVTTSTALEAYTFNGTTFTLVGSIAETAAKIHGDSNYIYLTSGGLKAYTFNGTTFTLAGSMVTTNYQDVYTDGTYVYLAEWNSGIRAYSFDGATFTLRGTRALINTGDVWGDGTYIYVRANGSADGDVMAYKFNGTSFGAPYGSLDTSINSGDIWSDGTYFYETNSLDGLNVYVFDGSNFILKARSGLFGSSTPPHVWGDGTYIYAASWPTGHVAFKFDTGGRCSCAAAKPLTTVGTTAVSGLCGLTTGNSNYIFQEMCPNGANPGGCNGDGVIYAYTFNGSGFTLLGSVTIVTYPRYIQTDSNNYLYVMNYHTGSDTWLDAYSFNGSTFTLAGSVDVISSLPRFWVGGGYIFVPDSGTTKAYTFNGSTFTLAGSVANAPSNIWGDGTYIYVTSGSTLYAYTFNGSTFTQRGSIATASGGIIHGNGTYIFVAHTAGLTAYSFDGVGGANGNFTLRGGPAANSATGNVDLWSDKNYAYLGSWNSTQGFQVFSFDGSNFTLVDNISGDNRCGIWGDGTYIYHAIASNSLKAYDPSIAPGPAGFEASIIYNNDKNTLQYCNGSNWQEIGR